MTTIRIRRLPEDFQVDEISRVEPTSGEFALYRLAKRSLTTLEAVETIARNWNIPHRNIQYAGMKDKHAITIQYITINHGPRENFKTALADLTYLGLTPRAIGPADIAANRFSITLRNFSDDAKPRIDRAIRELQEYYVPNYFDDQRFRSLGPSREFVAKYWCESNYEKSLWLSLAEDNSSDRAEEKAEKRILQTHWGKWAGMKDQLSRSHRRSIVTYLVDHPADFRGAFERVRVELRRIYLSAYQSYLWNHILSNFVQKSTPRESLLIFPHVCGGLPCYQTLDHDTFAEFSQLAIPLPSARVKAPDPEVLEFMESSLAEIGVSMHQIRVKHGRDAYFATAARPALSRPNSFVYGWDADELYPGRKLLRLSFELRPGAYASIIMKRLTAGLADALPDAADFDDDERGY
ncbi:MAG: tRNA pseudouridine(13) synthase TruD [Planctomycetota bacterium]